MCYLELVTLGTKKSQATPTNHDLEISDGHLVLGKGEIRINRTLPGFFTSLVERKPLGLGNARVNCLTKCNTPIEE